MIQSMIFDPDKIAALKEGLREKANRERVRPSPEPRYDEVFYEGVSWLNSIVESNPEGDISMKNPCPECGGKCCRDDLNYKINHMAAEFYNHECDLCYDGTDYVKSNFEYRDLKKEISRLKAEQNNAYGELKKEINKLKAEKDGAYNERNRLVALISKIFPSSLGRHEESDPSWDHDCRWIVYVNMPTGQCSWYIHEDDLPMFSHLEQAKIRWDGHSTEEKYSRISMLSQERIKETISSTKEVTSINYKKEEFTGIDGYGSFHLEKKSKDEWEIKLNEEKVILYNKKGHRVRALIDPGTTNQDGDW